MRGIFRACAAKARLRQIHQSLRFDPMTGHFDRPETRTCTWTLARKGTHMTSKDNNAVTGEQAAGGREALKGWIVMIVLVAIVLGAGYFYTH